MENGVSEGTNLMMPQSKFYQNICMTILGDDLLKDAIVNELLTELPEIFFYCWFTSTSVLGTLKNHFDSLQSIVDIQKRS
jgi:hypothetical protein